MRYETTYSRFIFGKEFENISKNSLDGRFLMFSEDRTIGTELKLPLNLSIKDFDIEKSYNLNIPNKLEGESHLENTSFYNIAMRYTFDL